MSTQQSSHVSTGSFAQHLAEAGRIGFVPLVRIPFEDTRSDGTHPEELCVLVHPETGTLLSVESLTDPQSNARGVHSSEMRFVTKQDVAEAGGSWDSPGNPFWHDDMAPGLTGQPPADLVFEGNLDTRNGLAAKFADVLDSAPQSRPPHPHFEAIAALSHRQDYAQCRNPRTGLVDFEQVDSLRRQRLQELCASAGLQASLFGVAFA